jgi:hypothetical protein
MSLKESEVWLTIQWSLEDVKAKIAEKLGIEDYNTLNISEDKLWDVVNQIRKQVENDSVERGWDSISTLLDETEVKKVYQPEEDDDESPQARSIRLQEEIKEQHRMKKIRLGNW